MSPRATGLLLRQVHQPSPDLSQAGGGQGSAPARGVPVTLRRTLVTDGHSWSRAEAMARRQTRRGVARDHTGTTPCPARGRRRPHKEDAPPPRRHHLAVLMTLTRRGNSSCRLGAGRGASRRRVTDGRSARGRPRTVHTARGRSRAPTKAGRQRRHKDGSLAAGAGRSKSHQSATCCPSLAPPRTLPGHSPAPPRFDSKYPHEPELRQMEASVWNA